ncbi:bifunctional tetrahydrofolate synthase/dihydrofolate synthase [Nitrosovibrio tenuis]|uniref:Dihydrofolate synthase/folylpolyglutamate synthase n=1 Tax=Nitrosovibrio tenuis TaxID=1233 RepID=A0A1H7MPU4_9PROT|nr:bifunctional tetrahydrofolate synthase/dihydrofolate synthase [Nitrosovibrio tenuis]SEL13099.1 dihydrofolate synthase / folylpolyglutamate synthase [Nitrosovibrio tenuis]
MVKPHSESRTLSDWLTYLEGLHPTTIEMGLGRVDRVRAELGLVPSFPVITVGGTNGKGSTCAMMEAILSCAGYRVGCYTSPHLLRYNERVRVAQREATDGELCSAFEAVETARTSCGVSLTYFEFGTLAAVHLFTKAEIEIAILEVGLGGRLDAVNIFNADCAVVTSVDFDHMDYLGNTREKIGFEKAGIFRKGKIAICSEPDIPVTVRQYANEIGAKLLHIGEHFGYSTSEAGWGYWDEQGKRHSLPYPALRGAYQLHNASACLAALDAVKDNLPVTMGDIRRGLLEVNWPARFQVLPGRPVTVLDVAHNPGAARALADNLDRMDRFNRTYAVFAMLKDKDIPGVAQAMASKVDIWLTAGIGARRGASSNEIVQALRAAGLGKDVMAGEESIRTFPDPAAAYAYACERATGSDRICVFGSFHTVAEVLRYRIRLSVVEHAAIKKSRDGKDS